MIRVTIAAALAAATLGSALASPAAAQDARLVERLYDPAAVVRINGQVNVQTTIQFGEGEAIENVAIGDSTTWQVTPNRRANLLFVKPLAARASTNMTVVTNRHTYLFDLVATPSARNPLYILTFTYPPEPEPVAEEPVRRASADAPNAIEMAAASDDYAVIDPADLSFAWASSGDGNLLPSEIYDNGSATFLVWPADRAMPAILVKDHQGNEGPANFATRDDVIVLDLVPAEIILRSGESMAVLTNQGEAGAFLADGTARRDTTRN
ncbi:type VI secretion protein [Erythrobacter arachoides]|uniref:Type VI secretion protein n=1 Tax=Aurantiacibacter arachoides TaxID=1850444 RepID=A0A845A415_9SPHN|nr:TrbG/VirB9 family P-type conjugative transfer protein [Aurantiacibacter arachoides]MXO94162.1 type VI secretion protein [Aurantiacibacter arachoides]GGD65577.1 P-type conjugative transfer protein VirB9 [Aurantiacibacter arachoides]